MFEPTSSGRNTNLTVTLFTTAKRVLFSGQQAYAVEFSIPDELGALSTVLTARVRRGGRIFLSCGAYETPKLLMLSGVGPATQLEQHAVPVVFDNSAVGQDLIDRKEVTFTVPMLNTLGGGDWVLTGC